MRIVLTQPLKRSMAALLLLALFAGSCVSTAAVVGPRLPRDDLPSDMSPTTHDDLICNLCEEFLAPAILKTVIESEAHHNTAESVETAMERVLQETESHVHQPLFHEHLMQILWTPAILRSFSAVQRLYHDYPDRSHLLERLIDHVVCSCRSHAWEHDRIFSRLLLRHAGLVRREAELHSERDVVSGDLSAGELEAIRQMPEIESMMPGGAERAPVRTEDLRTPEMVLGGMPGFGGMATGNERQGAEL